MLLHYPTDSFVSSELRKSVPDGFASQSWARGLSQRCNKEHSFQTSHPVGMGWEVMGPGCFTEPPICKNPGIWCVGSLPNCFELTEGERSCCGNAHMHLPYSLRLRTTPPHTKSHSWTGTGAKPETASSYPNSWCLQPQVLWILPSKPFAADPLSLKNHSIL